MKNVDLNFYPGWVRKAISFTIDDGNLRLDKKFIDALKPAGITGTFNLVSSFITEDKREAYYEQYREYEIANHMKYHPWGLIDGAVMKISEEPFNPETSDKDLYYKCEEKPGLYYFSHRNRWFLMTDDDNYIRLVNEGKKELEEIFGEGKIKDFVWPYGRQNANLQKRMRSLGYRSLRGTVQTDFNLPKNRENWGYYADCNNMAERSAEFASLPDDGELKAFIFGVHSHDFENAGKWDVLYDFADKFGNRPGEFYYGTVGDIFDTEDAIKSAVLDEVEIRNNSSRDMYIKIDGEKALLPAYGKISLI